MPQIQQCQISPDLHCIVPDHSMNDSTNRSLLKGDKIKLSEIPATIEAIRTFSGHLFLIQTSKFSVCREIETVEGEDEGIIAKPWNLKHSQIAMDVADIRHLYVVDSIINRKIPVVCDNDRVYHHPGGFYRSDF